LVTVNEQLLEFPYAMYIDDQDIIGLTEGDGKVELRCTITMIEMSVISPNSATLTFTNCFRRPQSVPQGEHLDMLIRSASSFLWIVKHNVKGPMNRYTAEWKRAVERLDRIATLLVTKPKLDVCAVIAEVRSDSVQLYNLAGADGTHEAALEHLLATKNSGKGKKQSQDQIPLPRKLPESRLKGDWLKAYIRQCVYTTLNSD
jgi:hypothetical protein